MALTFLSTRSRGFTYDMRLIEKALQKNSFYDFRYFTLKENSINAFSNSGTKLARKSFINDDDNLLCVDSSLPKGLKLDESEEGKRILIPISYDYQFKPFSNDDQEEKKLNFVLFTHIIPPSPLALDYLKQYCDTKGQTIIEGYCSPYAYELAKGNRTDEIKEKFYSYYPEAKGKKIVSIIRAGKYDEENPEAIINMDLAGFINELGEEYYVVTNVFEILEKMAAMQSDYRKSICFIDKMIKNEELLNITDVLISNNSMLLASFAVKRKPLYLLDYKDKAVELFFKKRFPSLIFNKGIKTAKEIKEDVFTKDMQNACDYLSYPADKDVTVLIEKLLKEKTTD